MQEQLTQLQIQVEQIQSKMDGNAYSSDIPRDFETALRERLNINTSLTDSVIAGTKQLTSGTTTITDSRIKTTSVIVITSFSSASPAIQYAATCSNGFATIFEQSGTSNDTLNYIIIL